MWGLCSRARSELQGLAQHPIPVFQAVSLQFEMSYFFVKSIYLVLEVLKYFFLSFPVPARKFTERFRKPTSSINSYYEEAERAVPALHQFVFIRHSAAQEAQRSSLLYLSLRIFNRLLSKRMQAKGGCQLGILTSAVAQGPAPSNGTSDWEMQAWTFQLDLPIRMLPCCKIMEPAPHIFYQGSTRWQRKKPVTKITHTYSYSLPQL